MTSPGRNGTTLSGALELVYQDEWVTLYCGDSTLLLDEPDLLDRVDVLITDPPYGVNFQGKQSKFRSAGKATATRAARGGYLNGDDGEIGPLVVSSLLPFVERAAVWPGIRLLHDYPKPADIGGIFNAAGSGRSPWGFGCFQPVAFYGTRPGHSSPTMIASSALSDDVDHPCPKPMQWLYWLVSIASRPGETIIDPFAGSGTTLRAAKDLGRYAVGIELEPRYCETIAARLAQQSIPVANVGAVYVEQLELEEHVA